MKTPDQLKDNLMFSDISGILPELTNHLLINGSMVFYSGLLYGKLGISLFFFHYGRYTKNPLYDEYARHLVDLVQSQIHEDYPLDYERGLSGIGTGLNYLQKHGYFDVGDDYMNNIDLRIIKAMSYEKRVNLLTGFGRYLVSRYEGNPTMKDSLIRLADLLMYHTEITQFDIPVNILSLLCDLYLLGIETKRIESYVSNSVEALIRNVQKEPVSWKLFTLIRISRIFSCSLCWQAAHEVFNFIFIKENVHFAGINDFQWLLQCKETIEAEGFQSFLPEVKKNITGSLAFFDISQLYELFSNDQDFAFQGGYAGLGLALISIFDSETFYWTNLL